MSLSPTPLYHKKDKMGHLKDARTHGQTHTGNFLAAQGSLHTHSHTATSNHHMGVRIIKFKRDDPWKRPSALGAIARLGSCLHFFTALCNSAVQVSLSRRRLVSAAAAGDTRG